MGKRKRSSEVQEAGAPVSKKQVVEKVPGASAAERRQLRSERKSKKGQQAKENSKKKRPETATEPEVFLPGHNATAGSDNIAGGEDFVSLNDATTSAPTPGVDGNAAAATQPQKKRKEKKASPRSERKKAKGEKAADVEGKADGGAEEGTTAGNRKTNDAPRFICFVGNLPYSCTTDQIQQHFRKLEPTSIRHSTDKATRKSKGFAFLEFDDYSRMKTCLKVYHHSIFDPERTSKLPDDAFDEHGLVREQPGQNKKQTGRKINVELTAGGGGKGADRKEKIQKKNTKLWEERERRKEADSKQQKVKDKMKKDERSGANSTDIGSEAVHPSRLKRVQQ
ncbi:hypothetical protein PMZ80_010817 [Knufia obscura]|uniref:RRM domain-containing protein n=2 Tax=Knufia TaxID=430999 RepID=A0AAN8EWZ7_9EURO|nr:hypothetical protein PMZ80_010817 [Knufia obscura]KAK5947861.1 hypothetical protein OHC33_011126 [Knufia fluminis]